MIDSLHPNVMALVAAFLIAVARVFYRTGLSGMTAFSTSLVINLVSMSFAVFYYHLGGGLENWPWKAVGWFALVGFCAGFTGRYLQMLSIQLVGLARAYVVNQSSLVWSAMLAVLFLGEQVDLAVGSGTLAIMCGSILLLREGQREERRVPLSYYSAPLVAALLVAMASLFRKFGLQLAPSTGLGMGLANGTAILMLLAAMPFTKEELPRAWDRRALRAVLMGALVNGLAAFFFWGALKNGKVVEVVPLNRLSILLVIFFSWLFFQKQERINLRIVMGGLLSVLGAFTIVWGR